MQDYEVLVVIAVFKCSLLADNIATAVVTVIPGIPPLS